MRDRLRACWNVDPSATQGLIVSVEVDMRPDGTVAAAAVAPDDVSRYRSDRRFKAFADRALRAVRNPACQPLPLPAGGYETWRYITFRFDPSDYF